MAELIRLITDEEMDIFLNLRETKGDKAAAKYMASLNLYEKKEWPETKAKKQKKV